jgi:hypothetical protein
MPITVQLMMRIDVILQSPVPGSAGADFCCLAVRKAARNLFMKITRDIGAGLHV